MRKNILDLCDLDFSCIFVDEAHRVKNPTSQTTIAFHKFACKTRFGLTGTAMQNRYSELHTLLDWCFPGCIGDASQWKDYVETPLKDAQKKDATQAQLAIGRVSQICCLCSFNLTLHAMLTDASRSARPVFTTSLLPQKVSVPSTTITLQHLISEYRTKELIADQVCCQPAQGNGQNSSKIHSSQRKRTKSSSALSLKTKPAHISDSFAIRKSRLF